MRSLSLLPKAKVLPCCPVTPLATNGGASYPAPKVGILTPARPVACHCRRYSWCFFKRSVCEFAEAFAAAESVFHYLQVFGTLWYELMLVTTRFSLLPSTYVQQFINHPYYSAGLHQAFFVPPCLRLCSGSSIGGAVLQRPFCAKSSWREALQDRSSHSECFGTRSPSSLTSEGFLKCSSFRCGGGDG